MNVHINIFGPSGSGKSTVIQLLQNEIDRLYVVDYDIVKRQISNYYWKRDRDLALQISLGLLDVVASKQLPLLTVLPTAQTQRDYDAATDITNSHGYITLHIELTAPEPVLLERLEQRLASIKASGTIWKFKTIDEYKDAINAPYYRPKDVLTFDSSTTSPDAIAQAILQRIGSL